MGTRGSNQLNNEIGEEPQVARCWQSTPFRMEEAAEDRFDSEFQEYNGHREIKTCSVNIYSVLSRK